MSKNFISRQEFLKLGSAAFGAVALSSFLPQQVVSSAKKVGLINAKGNGYIPTMCEMCVWRCGVLAKVRDGRVVKLEGNPAHPHSKGKLCARGQSGLMNTYDPDRILEPLIRVGKRGEIWWLKICSK
jgi:thiosulfate reductase/polysulfide reductase chain A